MTYFLDLSHFLMAKTEISLRKVTGKRQSERTEKVGVNSVSQTKS